MITTLFLVYKTTKKEKLYLTGLLKQLPTKVHHWLLRLLLVPHGLDCGTWHWIMKCGTVTLRALYHILTGPNFGQSPCSFCNNQQYGKSHFELFINIHSSLPNTHFLNYFFCICSFSESTGALEYASAFEFFFLG